MNVDIDQYEVGLVIMSIEVMQREIVRGGGARNFAEEEAMGRLLKKFRDAEAADAAERAKELQS